MLRIPANLIIQFVRNGLSCVKDWKAGPAILHAINTFAVLPEPYNKITPLEFVHGLSQLYPAIHVTSIGIGMLKQGGLFKAWRIQAIFQDFPIHPEVKTEGGTNGKAATMTTTSNKKLATKLVIAKLAQDGSQAATTIFLAVLYIATGCGFFWLFLNSFHFSEAGWLGGVWAVLYAVEEMLFCLIFLLYFMIADGRKKLANAQAMMNVAQDIKKNNMTGKTTMDLQTYEFMSEWDPFWNHKDGDVKEVEKEIEKVQQKLDFFLGTNLDKKSGEKEAKIRHETLQGIATRLEKDAAMTKMYGYRDLFFFCTNFIAFYGFTLGCLVYHIEEGENEPAWFSAMKFNMTHATAEWRGNHAGNWMWTLEPVITASTPALFEMMISSNNKTTATSKQESEKKKVQ